MKHLIFLLSLVLGLAACSKVDKVTKWESAFKDVQQLEAKNYLSKDYIWGRPFFIHYIDSCVIVYDDLGDSLFTLMDLKANNRAYRFGKRGQGKDDFLQVASFYNMQSDSLLGVYDMFGRSLVQMNINQVRRGIYKFPLVVEDTLRSVFVVPTKYHTYVGIGFYEKNMLSLYGDKIGRQYFFEYPYKDKQEKAISNRLRGMAYQGVLRSNPSMDKIVFSVTSAPIFFLYSVKKDRIIKTYDFIADYPVYKTEDDGTVRSAPMSAKNILGFVDAYATDKYVYLLYSGKSFAETGMKAFHGSVVYKITWDAKPVCKYGLDVPISTFCVSDDDSWIYAMAYQDEFHLVGFPISTKHAEKAQLDK